jgi:hypothetical protein
MGLAALVGSLAATTATRKRAAPKASIPLLQE